MVETSPLNSSLKTFSVGSGASMITACPLGRIMLGFPASVSASTLPTMTPWPVAYVDASNGSFGILDASWMLVRASGSTSGLLGDVLHNCCPSAAVAGMFDFSNWKATTVGVVDVASPMMMVPSGTTLTPGVWLSACASAAGIVAATALRRESCVICVAFTCVSWATSGACMDAAVACRADRLAWLAGRLGSWSLNTTTTCSCLPDERAVTWLELNLEKLGPTLAWAVGAAAQPTPVIAVRLSAAAPSNEAALRGVKNILLPPFGPSLGSLDITGLTPTRCRIKGGFVVLRVVNRRRTVFV